MAGFKPITNYELEIQTIFLQSIRYQPSTNGVTRKCTISVVPQRQSVSNKRKANICFKRFEATTQSTKDPHLTGICQWPVDFPHKGPARNDSTGIQL